MVDKQVIVIDSIGNADIFYADELEELELVGLNLDNCIVQFLDNAIVETSVFEDKIPF